MIQFGINFARAVLQVTSSAVAVIWESFNTNWESETDNWEEIG
jgi:hypothetical protein